LSSLALICLWEPHGKVINNKVILNLGELPASWISDELKLHSAEFFQNAGVNIIVEAEFNGQFTVYFWRSEVHLLASVCKVDRKDGLQHQATSQDYDRIHYECVMEPTLVIQHVSGACVCNKELLSKEEVNLHGHYESEIRDNV